MNTDDLSVARQLLERLGVRPEQLLRPTDSRKVPTFGEFIPRVAVTVSDGARRTYAPYWRQLDAVWHDRRLDEPTPFQLAEFIQQTQQGALTRRNSRGGRSAAEHMVSAIRCLYRFAIEDRHLPASDNPAAELKAPRRLPSTRRALAKKDLADIHRVASSTGNDTELDQLIIRIHIETACRRGTALSICGNDLDPEHCLVRLHGKNGTLHWHPISPTLMNQLIAHKLRSPDPDGQLLRYRDGRPITRRRYDHIWERISRSLAWVAIQGVSTHWIRYTTLTFIERNFGYAVAQQFAVHAAPTGRVGATLTYVGASIEEVAAAVSALTNEPHPLAPATEENELGLLSTDSPCSRPHSIYAA
ncbi:tyrosine-type recombinase/integrase [Nocardia brasiliensis]|uniref:tyrosine-type recombinase/integrase n=1 Tax=Nocardia brasiliensis TaxID=37326 RepID=UPI00245386CA|nr:site-specific integrase [Nocardia brasiliensis]